MKDKTLSIKQLTELGLITKCVGCRKKILEAKYTSCGKGVCKKCYDKMVFCVDSETKEFKSKVKYFKQQGIYIKDANEDNIKKDTITKKRIWVGEGATGDVVHLGDDKWSNVDSLVEAGYSQTSHGRWGLAEDMFKWGNSTYLKSKMRERLYERAILNYSYKPEPVFQKTVEQPHKGYGVPFLGFELEMSCIDDLDRITNYSGRADGFELEEEWADSEMLNEGAYNMATHIIGNGLDKMLYFKADSSVINGMEIVSHPMTLSFIKELPMKKFFEALHLNEFKDHDSCGMHVHVSRDALSKKQWWGLMVFMSKMANKMIKLSRRDLDMMYYCNFSNNTGTMEALSDIKGLHSKEVQNKQRYAAVNFNNSATVEFRMFRSTSSYEDFMGTLSLVEALVLFAREYSFMYIQDSRTSELWAEFCTFASRKKYGALIKFLEKSNLFTKIKK